MLLLKELSKRQTLIIEGIIIAFFSFFPLLLEFPYRVNIFVTWEGAYRMYLGQVPFRDFGLPLGYGFWILPWIFFKIFGPYMYTLVITQAFINFISLITLRRIFKLFNLGSVELVVSILVFCLTYVLVHFWPWYNHTVFVFELIGLYFLLRYILRDSHWINAALSAFFIALCFITKQDAGGFGLILSGVLLVAHAILNRSYKGIIFFALFYVASLGLFILPYIRYDFSYWFNYGQPPHFSRINLYDFLTAIFEESQWIKFYLIAAIALVFIRIRNLSMLMQDHTYFYFTLFTLGMLVQAMIIQVTSFSPPTTSYYYHTFGVAFLLFHLGKVVNLQRVGIAAMLVFFVLLWRSENYWKYSSRLLARFLPPPPPANVVSKNTWSSKADSVKREPVQWIPTSYRSLKNIKLPQQTAAGIERIKQLDVVQNNKNLKCLNLSNLTPLAHELNYEPFRGEHFPLWYHKGVSFFDRETIMLCTKIENQEFDLVLFEVMPDVDSFFPFDVRTCLQQHYKKVDTFPAATGYETDYVEVYVRQSIAYKP